MSPRVDFVCDYCGHTFHEYLYTADQADNTRCGKCDDKNVRIVVQKENDGDAFGYNKGKQKKDAYIK